ncbi:MAG: hypothetical protein RSE41_00175 [Clostridia bacterium]
MWVARDKNKELFLHEEKPYKEDVNIWVSNGNMYEIQNGAFPDVKWEDEEPRELILKDK